MTTCKTLLGLVLLECFCFSGRSHGQSTANETRHHLPVIALDSASTLALGSSLYCSRMTESATCTWLGAVGVATYIFGPSLAHLHYGEDRNALMSVGLRTLMPSLTLFFVLNQTRPSGDSGMTRTQIASIASSYVLPMVLDWVFLSKHNQDTAKAARMLSFTLPF